MNDLFLPRKSLLVIAKARKGRMQFRRDHFVGPIPAPRECLTRRYLDVESRRPRTKLALIFATSEGRWQALWRPEVF